MTWLWDEAGDYWNAQNPLEDTGDPGKQGPPPAPPVAAPVTPPVTDAPVVDAKTGGGGGPSAAPSALPGGFSRPVPRFAAPVFVRPSPEAVLASPGYQFRVQQGQQGIERSAAARGLLRTGGTLRDIAEYNQNFASNEYGNEFNRALQTFGTRYQGAKDEFAPRLAEWSTLANIELQRALAAYNRDTIWLNPKAGGGGGGSGPIILPPPNPPS